LRDRAHAAAAIYRGWNRSFLSVFSGKARYFNRVDGTPLPPADAEEFDRRIGTPGLHRVERSIHANERRSVLPVELIRKYENDARWFDPARNPHQVKVV
jgi:hypothetical protein